MSTGKNAHHDQKNKLDQNIEWDDDNATYGHSVSDSPFRRKNTPDEDHLSKVEKADVDVNEHLKTINLTTGDTPDKRNNIQEKGLGGKDI